MELIFAPAVLKQMRAVPKADAKRIVAAMQAIAADQLRRMGYVTKLLGRPGYWRAKKGDYRAICVISETAILVIDLGHRKDIYA